MNLFKKIFNKHLATAAPEKLADDLGPLRGVFSYHGYDHKNNLWLPESKKQNTLTNQSKSVIIRLISQQQSFWGNHTDPSLNKIMYMRFGNNDQGASAISKYNYYDLSEPSARESTPTNQPNNTYTYPGGRQMTKGPNVKIQKDPASQVVKFVNKTDAVQQGQLTIFTIKDDINLRPPAQNTLRVDLMKDSAILETLHFSNPDPNNPTRYTRTKSGIKPNRMIASSIDTFVSTPLITGTPSVTRIMTSNSDTRTLLFYDYNSKSWKIMVDELPNIVPAFRYNRIKVTYETGTMNVVNSIIPKYEYNVGTGNSNMLRFRGNEDFYTVLNNVEYRDADGEFIDDYSASFSINMGRNEGNGNLGASGSTNDNIAYREAFLFTGKNEMFSAIYLANSMNKNPDVSYYVSWTILAPL